VVSVIGEKDSRIYQHFVELDLGSCQIANALTNFLIQRQGSGRIADHPEAILRDAERIGSEIEPLVSRSC
jgi:hypothetical protein